MVIGSSTALIATNPISWPSAWNTDREASRSYDERRWGNGIVYMGVEANRTKQVYSASGIAQDGPPNLGQIIDIYV
ncbi:MAG: hypothetical protein DRH12_10025 [Deltaproteobacteria bacterium]|nr:MAG: hypothetical protein DRH12_10025 [Deltaproteobacteria bacterium]